MITTYKLTGLGIEFLSEDLGYSPGHNMVSYRGTYENALKEIEALNAAEGGGWRLPSQGEILLLAQMYSEGVGQFQNGNYWIERPSDDAYASMGYAYVFSKEPHWELCTAGDYARIRPVRTIDL